MYGSPTKASAKPSITVSTTSINTARIAIPNAPSQPVLKNDLTSASQMMKIRMGPINPRNPVSIMEDMLITITPTSVRPRDLA